MRAMYSFGHDLPCPRNTATAKLVHWLTCNAVWSGNRYTDREIPTNFQPEGYTPAWCDDIALLRHIAVQSESPVQPPTSFLCVCVAGWLHPAHINSRLWHR